MIKKRIREAKAGKIYLDKIYLPYDEPVLLFNTKALKDEVEPSDPGSSPDRNSFPRFAPSFP